MNAKFYNCKKDSKQVFKLQASDELTNTAINIEVLTPEVNVVRPKIRVKTDRLNNDANYCYIDGKFSRYYYIKSWTAENGYITMDLEVDVLMTYRKDLMKSTAIVKRVDNLVQNGSWKYPNGAKPNFYLEDSELPLNAYTNVRTLEFAGGFEPSTQTFFLNIAGDVVEPDDPDDPPSGGDYSIYVISAMCGNFWQESTINPGIWESLSSGTWESTYKGYGLGQWTNLTVHGRLYNLHAWLQSKGYADDDGDAQLSYLVHEAYWIPHNDYPQFQTLNDFLTSDSTDLTTLTHAFNQCWEGIHDSTWEDRVTYANTVYNYLSTHSGDSNTWIKGNNYLTDSQKLNNAVLVYQFFNN